MKPQKLKKLKKRKPSHDQYKRYWLVLSDFLKTQLGINSKSHLKKASRELHKQLKDIFEQESIKSSCTTQYDLAKYIYHVEIELNVEYGYSLDKDEILKFEDEEE
jgi:hypothetical protein